MYFVRGFLSLGGGVCVTSGPALLTNKDCCHIKRLMELEIVTYQQKLGTCHSFVAWAKHFLSSFVVLIPSFVIFNRVLVIWVPVPRHFLNYTNIFLCFMWCVSTVGRPNWSGAHPFLQPNMPTFSVFRAIFWAFWGGKRTHSWGISFLNNTNIFYISPCDVCQQLEDQL